MSEEAYPRPQLRRPHWQSLDGAWRFLFDDDKRYARPADIDAWPLEIRVPMPPESLASGIGDRGFHRCCWYEREVDVRPPPAGRRILLHFGAVDYDARVWVNGQFVCQHEGGHTPFFCDITDVMRSDGPQVVTVQAEDDPHDLAKPRGKQDWQPEPHAIWYPRTTGIWQTVWYEQVSATRIDKLRWTPHLERFELEFEAWVVGPIEAGLSIEVSLYHDGKLLARDEYGVVLNEVHRGIILSDPGIDDSRNTLLWSPERPTLLDARIRLRHGERVLDEIVSYTALRSVNVLRDRFMLNGRPYHLRLVLDQGYWPDTLLAAPSDEALRRDVELAKAMGFNGVRKHQKVESPRYLYWADRLGLLVWEEMPSAYRFTSIAVRRLVREWAEVIRRDYSHPCVIVWVPFNESWGVPDLPSRPQHRNAVEALYHLTRTLDSTRLVIGNDGWESSATDMIGIHDYDGNVEQIRSRYGGEVKREELLDRRRPAGRVLTLDGYPHRGQPVVLTEFGGIAYPPWSVAGGPVYSDAHEPDELARRYTELVQTVAQIEMFSGFCYTQFADTFQETNGLLYADRTPKVPLDVIARATRTSRTHIPGVV